MFQWHACKLPKLSACQPYIKKITLTFAFSSLNGGPKARTYENVLQENISMQLFDACCSYILFFIYGPLGTYADSKEDHGMKKQKDFHPQACLGMA